MSKHHQFSDKKQQNESFTASALTVIDADDYRPRHPVDEWFTLSSILGPAKEYRISYRQLEPSSYYVFRLFARNQIGIGLPSEESDQLFISGKIVKKKFLIKIILSFIAR